MKKLFLLITLLAPFAFVFAQTKEVNQKGKYGLATGGYKPNRQEIPTQPKNINSNNQSYKNDCYTNLAFTVKNYGYNKDGKFYSWGVSVKNNYTKAVSLRYKLIVGNDKTSVWAKAGTVTYIIKPGETYDNDMGTLRALIVDSSSDQYRIEVSEVCFEDQDCIKNGYADCNGKQKIGNVNLGTAKNNNSTLAINNINSNVAPITNLFDGIAKSIDEHNQKLINILTKAGFHHIGKNSYSGEDFAENFTFSYILDMNGSWYPKGKITHLYIKEISGKRISKEHFDVLLKMFCTNATNYTCKSGSGYINIAMIK